MKTAADHFDANTAFQPYTQYRVIRGYGAPATGGAEQWVIGARQAGGYTDDMAAWGLNFSQNFDSGQTISRLEDVWGRTTHQYDYLDVPGYGRKNQHQVRAFAYNAEGQVVSRRDYWAVGAAGPNGRAWTQADMLMPNRRFVISNGQPWAEVTEGAPARNELPEVEGLQSVAGRGYAAGGGSVAAQANETLQGVSQRVYGDARYWYVLAEANGLGRPDEALAGGTLLRVPALQVGFNAAGTSQPYSSQDALGSALPALPYIAPSPQNCGAVGQLLMVVVAVIATIYTAGAASGLAASMGGGLGGTLSAGVSALAGASPAAAALGGAVGSIASQGVGMLTGDVQRFSWRGVATSALTAGAGAGVGSAAQALGWTRTATAVASGLGSSVANAGVNGGFSWHQVAANVVGNAVGSAVGGRLGDALGSGVTSNLGQFAADFAGRLAGGMVSQAVSSQLATGTSRIDGISAFGDALGNTLVGRWTGRHSAKADQVRRHAAGVHELMNWTPGDGARDAPGDWGIFDPNGPYAARAGLPVDALFALQRQGIAQRTTMMARSGDNVSRLLATSNPQVIEAFMRLNGLSNSTIFAGREYVIPTAADIANSGSGLGQATLNADNARVAAARAQREAGTVAVGVSDSSFRFFEHPAASSPSNAGSAAIARTATPVSGQSAPFQFFDNQFLGGVGQAEAGTGVMLLGLERRLANVGWSGFRWLGSAPKVPIELMFDASGRYNPILAVNALPSWEKLQFGPGIRHTENVIDFGPAATKWGRRTAGLGPVLSSMEAVNTQLNPDSDSGDRFRDWGKAGVDTVATVAMFGGSKLTPLGWVYTVADFGVSFVEYTPRYGGQAGVSKSGWTALGYVISDAWHADVRRMEQLRQENPELWRQTIRRAGR